VKNPEWLQAEKDKAQKELDERQSRSQSLPVRIKQFERMNHLLGCLHEVNDCTVDSPVIRTITQPKPAALDPMTGAAADTKRRIALAKARSQRVRILALMIESIAA